MDIQSIAKARRLAASGQGRTIRQAAGVTIRDIAEVIGVDVSTVSRWETGQRQPRGDNAAAYGAVLSRLLGE